MSRGLDNNNAGNIVLTSTKWEGEIIPSRDSRFKTFISPAYGYRAIFILLRAYIVKGNDTIKKIFTRYVAGDNAEAYISSVVKITGIPKDQKIGLSDWEELTEIVKAISKVENGVKAIDSDVLKGKVLAKGKSAENKGKTPKNGVLLGVGLVLLVWGASKL